MRLAAAVAVMLILGAFATGWLMAPVGSADIPSGVVSPRPPRLSHPGASVTSAVQAFATLRRSASPAPVLPTPVDDRSLSPARLAPPRNTTAVPPTIVPSIDIAARFQRELTAVVGSEDGVVLWMADPASPTHQRRVRAGERFRDGWWVAAIDDQFVVLQRGKERRRVAIFGDEPGPEVAIVGAPATTGALPATGPPVLVTADGEMSPAATATPLDVRRTPRRQLLRPRPR